MVIIIIELVKIFFFFKKIIQLINIFVVVLDFFFFLKSIKKITRLFSFLFVSCLVMMIVVVRGVTIHDQLPKKYIYAVIMIMTTIRSFNQVSQCLKITIDTSLALGGGGGFQLYRDNHVFFLFCFHSISTRFFLVFSCQIHQMIQSINVFNDR